MEGTVSSDAGAMIRDGIKVVNSEGVCPETLWPYDIGMFTVKPPRRCYVAAEKDKAVQYEAIQTLRRPEGRHRLESGGRVRVYRLRGIRIGGRC